MTKRIKKILTISAFSIGILTIATLSSVLPITINKNHTNTTITNQISNHFSRLENDTTNNVVLNNLKYTLNNTNYTASVNGYESIPQTLQALTIPNSIQVNGMDYLVTSVSNGAFMNSNITSLTLPSNLLTIGNIAFANNFLQSLTIPSNVSSIGDNAFSNNMFNYGTKVFLPVNCSWNKAYGTSSFDTTNNYSVFTPCVQFVIQGSAVYSYNANQGGYVITSYMPNEIYQQESSQIQKVVNNASNVSAIADNDSTTPTYSTNNTDNNLNAYPTLLSTLSQTCLSFKGLSNSGTSGWVTFNTKTMTMNYTINSGNSSNEVYNNSATEFSVSMYNPNNNTYIIPLTYEQGWQASKYFAELWQGKTFAYGDIITFNMPSSWIGGNNTNALLNVSTNYYDGITPSKMNSLYFINNAWSMHVNDIVAFRITPLGLIPYVNTTKITNNSLNVLTPDFSGDFNITGSSTPNTVVYANVNGTVYKATSNSDGEFSVAITDQKNLSVSSIIQIYSNTSPIYFVHPEGANPNEAIITFNVNGVNFGITFNGILGGLSLWYQNTNRLFPDFETPYFNSQASTLSLDQTITSNTQLVINAKYSSNKNTTTTFDFTNGLALTTMESELNKISLTDLTNLQILCHNINLTNVFNNGIKQQIGFDYIGDSSNYEFTYSIANGITSSFAPISGGDLVTSQTSNANIGASGDVVYAMTPFSIYGGYSGGWDAKYYLGVYHKIDGDYSYQIGSNWYDPTPAMYNVAHSLVNGISNPVAQAVQVIRWVRYNFYYNNESAQMDYDMSASQEFNNASGICGDFANLSAMMLTLDGFVTRVITGGASDTATLFNSNNAIDHAWLQVWFPTYGEWLTFDPTWYYWLNPGNWQSYFTYSRVSETVSTYLFPPYNSSNSQTLFSSYFKNYPWQELSYFGNYYGIAAGQNGAIMSPYTTASIASLFDNQASLMSGVNYLSNYSDSNNFWAINVNDTYYLNDTYYFNNTVQYA